MTSQSTDKLVKRFAVEQRSRTQGVDSWAIVERADGHLCLYEDYERLQRERLEIIHECDHLRACLAERDARIAALEKALTDRQNRIVWMEDALLATEKPHE